MHFSSPSFSVLIVLSHATVQFPYCQQIFELSYSFASSRNELRYISSVESMREYPLSWHITRTEGYSAPLRRLRVGLIFIYTILVCIKSELVKIPKFAYRCSETITLALQIGYVLNTTYALYENNLNSHMRRRQSVPMEIRFQLEIPCNHCHHVGTITFFLLESAVSRLQI